MSLPEAETRLEQHLADRYANTDWRPALKAVMDAEGDIATALEAVGTLATTASQRTGLKIRIPARPKIPTQPPTIEELLDPVEEREVGDHDYEFPGGDNEIVEEV
ncbi:hypothetical protein BDR05DRAFT_867839, partial [Suillus weaverae]